MSKSGIKTSSQALIPLFLYEADRFLSPAKAAGKYFHVNLSIAIGLRYFACPAIALNLSMERRYVRLVEHPNVKKSRHLSHRQVGNFDN
jgi:hypothetical protein